MKSIYLVVNFIVMLTACSPVATATPTAVSATSTKLPPASFTPPPPTPILSPTETQVFPTLLPGPTSTALPALRPGQLLTLTSLHMMDEQTGWGLVESGQIVHTLDGGNTWKDVTPHARGYTERGFFALDANTAWATPDEQGCVIENCPPLPDKAAIWHTSDGGETWQAGQVCLQGQECNFDFAVPPDYYHPLAIQFLDAQTGWLLATVAHGMFQDRYRIYQTTDGGAHWSPIIDSSRGPMTNNATGLAFQDPQTAWLSTSEIDGATDPVADWSIYRSTDAGLTWNTIQLPPPHPLPKTFANHTVWCGATGISLVQPNGLNVTAECRVYTDPLSLYEFYFHSTDGGWHWASWLQTGDVDFLDPNIGWRLTLDHGAYDLEQTQDGGQTWVKLKAVKWNGDLDFVNEQIGWSIATSDNITTLVHTADGGRTWEEIKAVVAP